MDPLEVEGVKGGFIHQVRVVVHGVIFLLARLFFAYKSHDCVIFCYEIMYRQLDNYCYDAITAGCPQSSEDHHRGTGRKATTREDISAASSTCVCPSATANQLQARLL